MNKLLFNMEPDRIAPALVGDETVESLVRALVEADDEANIVATAISNTENNLLTGESMMRTLQGAQALLDGNVSELTYEAAVTFVSEASEVTGYGLDANKFTVEAFQADHATAVAELAETTEGFLADMKASIGRTSRKILRSTTAFLTVLTTRQKAISKLAMKLMEKMNATSPGNIQGTSVKNTLAVSWFSDAEQAISHLDTYSKARTAITESQRNLTSFIDSLDGGQTAESMTPKLLSILTPFKSLGEYYNDDTGMNSITLPMRSGRWLVTGLGVTAMSGAAYGGVIAGRKLTKRYAAKAMLTASKMGPSIAKLTNVGNAVKLSRFASVWGRVSGAGGMIARGATGATPMGVMAMIAMHFVIKGVKYAMAERLPTLEYNEVNDILSSITDMGSVEINLKGVAKASFNLEKFSSQLEKTSQPEDKAAAKGFLSLCVKITGNVNSLGRKIYSNSVSVARAGAAYASASLKVHAKNPMTMEDRSASIDEEWVSELDMVTEALSRGFANNDLVDDIYPEDQFDSDMLLAN